MVEVIHQRGDSRPNWKVYAAFAVVVGIAAMIGSMFMPGPWYFLLEKPWWTPPPWVFPLAWTPLYVMIAIAGAKTWYQPGAAAARVAWVVQMILNVGWTATMFGAETVSGAFAVIVLLLASMVAFMVTSPNRTATWLFVPYLAWVSFAATLNYEIWNLNPTQ
jgi:translocator protein